MNNPPTKVKYLTNKNILEEIHRSKITYCSYVEPAHVNYDFIVTDVKQITKKRIEEARKKKLADLIALEKKQNNVKAGAQLKTTLKLKDIPEESIVARVMTNSHVPLIENVHAKTKVVERNPMRCNFPPFQHYIRKDGELLCVLKSHWDGGLQNGKFSKDHGKMTNNLVNMFIKLVERYSYKSNWRNYTYLDEMKSQALLQLSQVGLQFDESRSSNPFAYYTQILTNSFRRILAIEKNHQNIRDDILIMNGVAPSYTRMVENDMDQKKSNND